MTGVQTCALPISRGMSKLQFDVTKLVYFEEQEYGNKVYAAAKGKHVTEIEKPSVDYMPNNWNEQNNDLPF